LFNSGCKIKALRAKTNTYIKTPVRGEEPVFVVTGRKEDVAAAKREILSAAEHFSQIRASRRSGLVGQCGIVGTTGLVPPPPVPGQVTIQVCFFSLSHQPVQGFFLTCENKK
jgi:RNA-binding protein MEX3